jgi:hypothetical protein
VGAFLSQREIGKDVPIALASPSRNKEEKNYCIAKKEILAIIWGVRYYRPYGTKFTVVTDHKPLIWIMSVKDPGSRLSRWAHVHGLLYAGVSE